MITTDEHGNIVDIKTLAEFEDRKGEEPETAKPRRQDPHAKTLEDIQYEIRAGDIPRAEPPKHGPAPDTPPRGDQEREASEMQLTTLIEGMTSE